MPISFNADEIFEMAEEIERNGARFYRKAARTAEDKQVKQMLLDMAVMEDGHLKTFEQMREELGEGQRVSTVFDPDGQSALYLQAMADARGWEGRKSPADELAGRETIKEVLEIALNSEKESVVFYYGLKDLVPVEAGRNKVEDIIIEELGHITDLLNQLKALQQS